MFFFLLGWSNVGEEDLRSKLLFSSHHIKDMYYHCDITIEVYVDHLASNIVYLVFSHHEVNSFLFPLPCYTLEEVTMCRPHFRISFFFPPPLGIWDLSFLTGDQTHAHCIGKASLNKYQRNSIIHTLKKKKTS